jgi:3-methyladenine DNA glycosylase AlkD
MFGAGKNKSVKIGNDVFGITPEGRIEDTPDFLKDVAKEIAKDEEKLHKLDPDNG